MCLKSCQGTPNPPQLFMLLLLLFLGCRWQTPASSLPKQPSALVLFWLPAPGMVADRVCSARPQPLPCENLIFLSPSCPRLLLFLSQGISANWGKEESRRTMAIYSPKADHSSQSETVIAFYKRARLGSAFESRSFALNFSILFQHKPCESAHDKTFTLKFLSSYHIL